MEPSLEMPRPPAWYARDDLEPPPVPANKNIRAFGSPDFDEAFWTDAKPAAEHCAEIARLNDEAVLAFCALMRTTASGDPDAPPKIEAQTKDLEAKFAEMHGHLGALRIHEARKTLRAHRLEQTRQRREAAATLRAAAADARAKIADMLAGPDAPLPIDPENTEEAIVKRAVRISDEYKAHEAAEHAKACLAGNPPPTPEPWASNGVEPEPDMEGLQEFLDSLKATCEEAKRQEDGREAYKEARRQARAERKAARES